ncbi:ABC transporter ATP-binding protein/permease [Paenibacillus sp. N1-5-1-14]|nr:ABC transporter ATP-binding protein [Paenibacillus radicibacter]MCR8644398.1 ABC transporter ATP-binding protein/permease [Paenibacillus radicibacter]
MRKASGLQIMRRLIVLVMPLMHVMLLAIVMGVIGFLCSIMITVFGGYALLDVLGLHEGLTLRAIFISVILFAVLRGVLRYAEQSSNHYIAFKLLAIIRNKVFQALRRLAPAKLEGKDKGNLISIITSDVEMLEVFYAHTISPIAIAGIVSLFMTIFIGKYSLVLGAIALVAYIVVGIVLPMITSRLGRNTGAAYRGQFGEMNSSFLDNLRGLREIIQFGHGEKRIEDMNVRSKSLGQMHEKLVRTEGVSKAMTDTTILLFTVIMLLRSVHLYQSGKLGLDGVIIATIALISSFGPVVALSNLANNLLHTLASGERVLDLLDEAPVVEDVVDGKIVTSAQIDCQSIDFAYGDEQILRDFSLHIPAKQITGIQGKSGSGKSTLLKLMMRFWDPYKGQIQMDGTNLKDIRTTNLRQMQSFVTQDTELFHDTIASNI